MVVDLATRPEAGAAPAARPVPVRFRAARVLLAVVLVSAVAIVVAGVYDAAANRLISDHLGLVAGAVLAGLLLVVALRAPLHRPDAARGIARPTAPEAEPEDVLGHVVETAPDGLVEDVPADGWHRRDRQGRRDRRDRTRVTGAHDAVGTDPAADAADMDASDVADTDVAGRHAGRTQDEAGDEPGGSPRTEVAPKDISPRALLLQVRTLEATLAEEDRRLASMRRETSRRAAEQVRVERERVRLTLRVLREAVAGQPVDVATARIEAALERLAAGARGDGSDLSAGASTGTGAIPGAEAGTRADAGPSVDSDLAQDYGFVRPVLATGASSAWAVTFAPPVPLVAPAGAASEGVTSEGAGGTPDGDAASEHDGAAAPADAPATDAGAAAGPTAAPAADAVPEPPAGPARVLPVPPLSAPAAPARKGRRLRRSKAGV